MATGISYCDEVWNVCVGCTKIKSGCQNCWAEKLHNQRCRAYYNPDVADMPEQYAEPFSTVQLLPDRLNQPLHWHKPRTIFVNSMGDTFHKDVPFEFIGDILRAMRQAERHTYLLFTKRYERALDWYNSTTKGNQYFIRDYVHLYFSVSTQKEVDEAVPILLQIPVAKRGLSLEPLLSAIHLDGIFIHQRRGRSPGYFFDALPGLHSVIVGCESGPNRRLCDIADIKSVADQCKAAGVPCYVKQIPIDGKCITLKPKTRAIWPAWAVQEMPK